jgi:hypothetical protein
MLNKNLFIGLGLGYLAYTLLSRRNPRGYSEEYRKTAGDTPGYDAAWDVEWKMGDKPWGTPVPGGSGIDNWRDSEQREVWAHEVIGDPYPHDKGSYGAVAAAGQHWGRGAQREARQKVSAPDEGWEDIPRELRLSEYDVEGSGLVGADLSDWSDREIKKSTKKRQLRKRRERDRARRARKKAEKEAREKLDYSDEEMRERMTGLMERRNPLW